jgi:phosphoribosyl 1,2-cyclic phosphate phosphodiesterase
VAEWELIITGCGTSHGSPPWGLPQLWSTDPRDHRRRSGAILRGPQGEILLIDVGPDLQHQLRDPYRRWNGQDYPRDCICRCDGVLLTHAHADHCHGLNDLRHLNRLMGSCGITMYGHAPHLAEVRRMFPYCFSDPHRAYELGSPALATVAVEDGQPFVLCGLPILAVPISHGSAGRVTGWRAGRMAYLTDIKALPAEAEAHLRDLDLLVMSMLREEEHPTHCNWREAQDLIARIGARQTVLVHMGHEVRYADWQARLPATVSMAVDGLSLRFSA